MWAPMGRTKTERDGLKRGSGKPLLIGTFRMRCSQISGTVTGPIRGVCDSTDGNFDETGGGGKKMGEERGGGKAKHGVWGETVRMYQGNNVDLLGGKNPELASWQEGKTKKG